MTRSQGYLRVWAIHWEQCVISKGLSDRQIFKKANQFSNEALIKKYFCLNKFRLYFEIAFTTQTSKLSLLISLNIST